MSRSAGAPIFSLGGLLGRGGGFFCSRPLLFVLLLVGLPAGADTVDVPMAAPPPIAEGPPFPVPAETKATDPLLPPPLLSPNMLPAITPPPLLVPLPALDTAPIPLADAANCVRRDEKGRFMGWMDYQHCVFSGRTLVTARWFDDFFGDWHDDEASMLVRLISQVGKEEGETPEARISLRLSASLPNISKRLRLIVSEEDDEETPLNKEVSRNPEEADSRLSAALRWRLLTRSNFKSDFDIGVRGIDPPEAFVRARARKTWSLTRDSIARLGQTLQYGVDSRELSRTQLDLERAVGDSSVLRLSNAYEYSAEQEDEGFRWTHGISMSHALAKSHSLTYGFSWHGHTQPSWRDESVGPWAIYRRSFLRPWLFYELEPRYVWRRGDGWGGAASILLRLEMQVGTRSDDKEERKRNRSK